MLILYKLAWLNHNSGTSNPHDFNLIVGIIACPTYFL